MYVDTYETSNKWTSFSNMRFIGMFYHRSYFLFKTNNNVINSAKIYLTSTARSKNYESGLQKLILVSLCPGYPVSSE